VPPSVGFFSLVKTLLLGLFVVEPALLLGFVVLAKPLLVGGLVGGGWGPAGIFRHMCQEHSHPLVPASRHGLWGRFHDAEGVANPQGHLGGRGSHGP
jgi:hypothetical protein